MFIFLKTSVLNPFVVTASTRDLWGLSDRRGDPPTKKFKQNPGKRTRTLTPVREGTDLIVVGTRTDRRWSGPVSQGGPRLTRY